MRSVLFVAAITATAVTLWLPGEAAQPAPVAASASPITFEQYRDWRNAFIDRRRSQLAAELATADLTPAQKARLDQARTYYDWLAKLPEAERNQRFRERFERIDTNHDGTVDADERAAWRDKQRAFYHSGVPAPQQPATEVTTPPSQ